MRLDPRRRAPLSQEEQAEIDMLTALEGDPVDLSDIPALDDAFWERAVRNPFLKRA